MADEVKTNPTSLTIYGEKKIGAKTFLIDSHNISSRTKTNNSVSWEPNPWTQVPANGLDQYTPDLSNILNEIIALDDYSLETPFVFIFEGDGYRVAETVESDSINAPILHYSYKLNTTITSSISDVYPGDLNHDGIVNNQDVAWSGTYFGEIGPSRATEHQNIEWYDHPAEDWGTKQLNNEDIKHFDCNGDGFIDLNDRQAVEENMGQIWETPTTPIPPEESDYQIVLHPIEEIENNLLRINVALENTADNDLVLQGGHFTVDYGIQNQNIVNATMNFYSVSWLGALNLYLIAHVQNFPESQTIEVGFTRIDGLDAIGSGVIGELLLQLDNSVARTAKQNNCILQIAINTIGMHDSQPTIQPVEDRLLQINLCESTCKNSWYISDKTQFQNAYESTNLIETEGFLIIGDKQQVEYRSSNVLIKSGFEVKAGASFEAGYGDCD